MKELNTFRKFLNENLEEGFFDMFKKKEQPGGDRFQAREEANYETAGEMINSAKSTLSQMTDKFTPELIQKKTQDLDDLYQLALEGGDPGKLTDEGLEQLEIGIKNILNLANFDF